MKEKTKNLTTPILIVLLVVAAFLVGSLWTKNQTLEKGTGTPAAGQATQAPSAQQQAPAMTIDKIREAFNKSLVKFGKSDNKLLIVEVSDPSCPYCQIAAGQNGELNKQAGDRFKLVKDGGTYLAPIPEIKKLVDSGKAAFTFLYSPGHGSGEMGTKAMYCAFEKGKYWEVHGKLMTSEGYDLLNNTVKNDKTKSGELADFLKAVFDPTVMKACLDSGKYDSQLQIDKGLASGLGVSGTPGFFINTTNFAGAYSYKDMEAAVTSSLK